MSHALLAARMLVVCASVIARSHTNFLTKCSSQFRIPTPEGRTAPPGKLASSAGRTFRKIFTATQPPSSHDVRVCASGRVTDKENPNG